jgi:hypothetical protein
MYVKLIPIKFFVDNIQFAKKDDAPEISIGQLYSGKIHPWMDKVKTFVLEGTAPVEPFPSIKIIGERADRLRTIVEAEGVQQTLPNKLDRVFRPSWGNFQDSFYEVDGHIYTDQLIRAGINIGSFAIYNTEKKEYGVPFQQVLEGRGVSFMPHQIVSASDIKLLQDLLKFDAPTPVLTSSFRDEEWKQNVLIINFKKQLELVEEPASEYYNDYIIKRPLEVSKAQYEQIAKFLTKKSKHLQVREEGTAKGLYTLHIRSYLIPKEKIEGQHD